MVASTSVIVHFGDPGPTVRLANTLDAYGTSVVCVANDGRDRPPELAQAVEWLVAERNLGYGAAFEFGIAGRSSDVFVLLNNDVVLSAETFGRCVEVLLSEGDIGIVGPVLRRANGSLQSGAAHLSRWRRAPRVLVEPGLSPVDC